MLTLRAACKIDPLGRRKLRPGSPKRQTACEDQRRSGDDSSRSHTGSPLAVVGEDVISCLHYRVAREPALGVVPLWWVVGRGSGLERIGRRVIVEHGISPATAVREPLAVL